jgi:hypothetical protein
MILFSFFSVELLLLFFISKEFGLLGRIILYLRKLNSYFNIQMLCSGMTLHLLTDFKNISTNGLNKNDIQKNPVGQLLHL